MEHQFPALATTPLPPKTELLSLSERPRSTVTFESPAIDVMTDLRVVDPVSIRADVSIDEAQATMVRRAIRLLFVVDDNEQFLGLITASDVQGERPLQVTSSTGKRHAEIVVADVMTPREHLEALPLTQVTKSKVGNLVSTMKHLGRQHALVVDKDPATGQHALCGLFSTSNIARRLGVSLNFVRVPRTFSEIEHNLLHHA